MNKELFENNLIFNLCLAFSLLIIECCEQLETEKKYVIARPLLKSGTSIGANVIEAQNPEGKTDFIHIMILADAMYSCKALQIIKPSNHQI